MKSIIIVASILLSSLAYASEQRISNCSSWKYSFEAQGYVCSFTNNVYVYESRDIDALARRIDQLEQELTELKKTKEVF